jgi:capsule biosynthesis phosphatase
MKNKRNAIVVDLDGCICKIKKPEEKYINAMPNTDLINKLKEYSEKGFYIVIYTSRNMNTYGCNIGKINAFTLKTIHEWLDKHKVHYDEIHIGKPWCGFKGFYIDDKTIRPDEFMDKSLDEIYGIIGDDSNE